MRPFYALLLLALHVPALAQGQLYVSGGGSDVSDGTAWFVAQAEGSVVVLDYTNDPGLGLVDDLEDAGATVTYLPISSEAAANDEANADLILASGGVFLPGGDQSEYVETWKGTLVEDAIRALYLKGGVIGGTSAGAAVLGEVAFDATRGSFSSRRGLLNPMHPSISLTDDFLNLAPDVVFDTHFYERGRLARMLAMLVRYHADTGRWVMGVGIDDGTAIAVDADGVAEVMGTGAVAVARPRSNTPSLFQEGGPLALAPIPFSQYVDGFRFDLATGALVEAPGDAQAFAPTALVFDDGLHWLDGSASASDWLADDGSATRFVEESLPLDGQIAVLSDPESAPALAVATHLQQFRDTALTPLDPSEPNDPDVIAAIETAQGFVFVDADLATTGELFQLETGVGTAFHGNASATLSLGPSAKLFGSEVVRKTEDRSDASFQGLLQLAPGVGLADGLLVMPLAWDADDVYWENQTAGLFWGLAQSRASLGVLIPEGTVVRLDGSEATTSGAMPVLVVDARTNPTVGFPFRRHNAAVVDATIRVLPLDEAVDLATPTVASEGGPGALRRDLALYPNPSRATATLLLETAAAGSVGLAVYDVLGRRVSSRSWDGLAPGEHRLGWTWPASLPSGTYIVRVTLPTRAVTLRATRLR